MLPSRSSTSARQAAAYPAEVRPGKASRARCDRHAASVCRNPRAPNACFNAPSGPARATSVAARSPSSRASRSKTVPPSRSASARPGGKRGRRTLAHAPRDAGRTWRGLAREPLRGALGEPGGADPAVEAARAERGREAGVAGGERAAGEQRGRARASASRASPRRSRRAAPAAAARARGSRSRPPSRPRSGARPARSAAAGPAATAAPRRAAPACRAGRPRARRARRRARAPAARARTRAARARDRRPARHARRGGRRTSPRGSPARPTRLGSHGHLALVVELRADAARGEDGLAACERPAVDDGGREPGGRRHRRRRGRGRT